MPSFLVIVVGFAAFGVFVSLAYRQHWHWTGLPAPRVEDSGDSGRSAKTLWDWLQLLGIPLALAVLALLINDAQSHREERRAADVEQETTLRTYLAQMSDLMLDRQLLHSKGGADVRAIARTTTLTAVRRLDGRRRGQVVLFLAEARLLRHDKPASARARVKYVIDPLDPARARVRLKSAILTDAALPRADLRRADLVEVDLTRANLAGADLTSADLVAANLSMADLSEAFLSETTLRGANLTRASLTGAYLDRAQISGSRLRGAQLRRALLSEANLRAADLRGADLRDADLRGADLRNADLRGADLRGADLRGADIRSARLGGAMLTGADLRDARGVI